VIMNTHWKIELLCVGRWRQIGFPDDEDDAKLLFARAIREYPADRFIRLREGERICDVRSSEGY